MFEHYTGKRVSGATEIVRKTLASRFGGFLAVVQALKDVEEELSDDAEGGLGNLVEGVLLGVPMRY